LKISGNRNSVYRPEIDGVRAFAVLAVIAHHFNKDLLPGGYLGVDVFFVISGYVITASLWDRPHFSLKNLFLGFYSRRVKRLVPALVTCIAITGITVLLFNPYPKISIETGVTALFGVSNIYLYWLATDYFGSSAELNFFTQTWTLGVEEQFYLAFPFVLWFTGFTRRTVNSGKSLLLAIGLLSALSFVAYLFVIRRNPSAGYFLTPYRFWELGAGCLLFVLFQHFPFVSRMTAGINPAIPLVSIIAVFFLPLSLQIPATVAVVGLTALLVGSIRPGSVAYRLLTVRPAVYIGLISYSLYLWHWSVLVISRWTIGVHWWSVPIQLGLIFLLAALSYQYIEKPMRRKEWNSKKILDIAYALISSFLVAISLYLAATHFGKSLFLSEKEPVQIVSSGSKILKTISAEPGFQRAIQIARKSMIDCDMTPHHLRGENYRPAPTVDDDFIANCLHTDKNKVVLIGDSFALNIGMHVAHAAHEIGYDFASITGYGCPYPLDIKNLSLRAKSLCEIDPQELMHSIIENLNVGDILVFRLFFSKFEYVNLPKELSEPVLSVYDDEISAFSGKVHSKGASLIVIGSNATLEASQACQYPFWFNYLQRLNNTCDYIDTRFSEVNRFSVSHNEHLQRLSQFGQNKFAFIDPVSLFCSVDRRRCPVVVGGVRQMFDNYHLTVGALDALYVPLLRRLKMLSHTKE